jgi:hypothetical protein
LEWRFWSGGQLQFGIVALPSPNREMSEDGGRCSERELLQRVMEFCIGSNFERSFEDFAEENKTIFLQSLDMDDKAEHPLSFHDCYLDYLRKFESKIERFIESTGWQITDFFKKARSLLESPGDELGEDDGAHRFFLEALLATSEYENFVSLMKGEMVKYRRPTSTVDDDEDRAEGKSHK